ncbi:ELAV-like protein 3 [Tetrabaena socialis]|uniref:ELAV-like protein 3 n=1 Tax=Tetrabaena socialis TaxID=47790 RepID=A0A2J8A4Z3_9CHLO|nr:ELAV-like protein 3 [Tetrabaena socialis]|eukprot:PNH07588.1 ELAV-like protein 3 [Tetrabaena socialis]
MAAPLGAAPNHPNLYIRNLPPQMDQTGVEVLFRPYGQITGCKHFKASPVPYAFIRLGTPAEALGAINALNGTLVQGKLILVKHAEVDATYDVPNENLYVRNLPNSWNEEDIRQCFENRKLVSLSRLQTVACVVPAVPLTGGCGGVRQKTPTGDAAPSPHHGNGTSAAASTAPLPPPPAPQLASAALAAAPPLLKLPAPEAPAPAPAPLLPPALDSSSKRAWMAPSRASTPGSLGTRLVSISNHLTAFLKSPIMSYVVAICCAAEGGG